MLKTVRPLSLPFSLLLLVLLLVSRASLAADNCEALRVQIEANIAAKGVTGFSVTTVDTLAQVPGQVVGTCAQGARKIVYARGSGSSGGASGGGNAKPAARPAVSRPTREEDILTECRDGTVSMGGRCNE